VTNVQWRDSMYSASMARNVMQSANVPRNEG